MARGYANGGPVAPPMESGIASGMMPPPPPPAAAPPMNMPPPPNDPMGGIPPQEQISMASELAGQFENSVDAAETPEEMMDAVRGAPATMEERRAELAGLVGEKDAADTPESVLIILQPLMGQLAQQG
tara:strand:- start:1747 stop:2130 length:384 start_codon:yes stop_codon:yes gene_type:complete